jgi:hypothetical protein
MVQIIHHIMLRTIEFIDLLNVLWAKPTINPKWLLPSCTGSHRKTESGMHGTHRQDRDIYKPIYADNDRKKSSMLREKCETWNVNGIQYGK